MTPKLAVKRLVSILYWRCEAAPVAAWEKCRKCFNSLLEMPPAPRRRQYHAQTGFNSLLEMQEAGGASAERGAIGFQFSIGDALGRRCSCQPCCCKGFNSLLEMPSTGLV